MHPISIVYHAGDAEKWSVYLHKLLSRSGVDTDFGLLDLTENAAMLRSTVDTSTVVAVMVSPSMLEPDMENVFKELQEQIRRRNIVLLNCFLEAEEKEEIFNKFTFLNSLKLLDVTVDTTENHALVSELLGTADAAEEASKQRRLRKMRNALKFRMTPDTIYQQPTVVCLNFEREVHGTVTVSCGKGTEQRIKTDVYNPFSVMFTIESLCEGKNKVRVFVDDTQVGKCELHMQSPVFAAYESPAYLCQVLGLCPNDMEVLDKSLVNIFKQSAPDDQSHISLMASNVNEKLQESQSGAEIPSLLHFAAKNGLTDLCALLLNIPGAKNTYSIANCRGKNVYGLAIESGFHDLADYTKMFLETEAMVLGCNTIYLSSSRQRKDESMKPEDAKQKQTNCTEERPSEIDRYYSLPKEIQGARAKPVLPQEQCSPHAVDDRPPQPLPRISTPVTQRRENVRKQSQSDMCQQKSCDVTKTYNREPPLSPAQFMGMESSYPHAQFYEPESKTGSQALDELVEIKKQVHDGEFTVDEAARLFESWKKRNAIPSASIRQQKQKIQDIKEQYETLIKDSDEDKKSEIKGTLATFKNLFTTKKKKAVNIQISNPLNRTPSMASLEPTRWSNVSSLSSGSSGSRESQLSRGSVDSSMGASVEGSESDEAGDETTDVQLRKKSDGTKKPTKKEKFLRSITSIAELDLPPPKIPPRKYPPPPSSGRKY